MEKKIHVCYAVGTVDCHFVTSTHAFPSLYKTSPGCNFCHKNRVANTVLVTKIASRRCLPQAWKYAKIVFGPDPTGGAYSAPLGPLAGAEGAGRPLPKNPHVSSQEQAATFLAMPSTYWPGT